MAAIARRRRNAFASTAEARAFFASKPLFSTWTPQALIIYAECGLRQSKPGVGPFVLKCDPVEGEARFFANSPLLTAQQQAALAAIRVPVLIVRGALSEFLWSAEHAQELMARCFSRQRLAVCEGMGHLGLMENPDVVAALLLKVYFALRRS